jgi:hypothetical protein
MYCSDQFGTDVDHYEPLSEAPLRTFDWWNHILACGPCNSSNKRGDFPTNQAGEPLFLDPTTDDPWDHLRLSVSTGLYIGLTDRGSFTAERLLNGDLIARGRQAAWLDALDHVRAYADAVQKGDAAAAISREFRLLQRPNLDVFYALLRYVDQGSTSVVPADVVGVVREHRGTFRSWIGL